MISVSLASFAYIFFTQTFSSVTDTGTEAVEQMTTNLLANMKIDAANEDSTDVYVRNTGKVDVDNLIVYVNGVIDNGASYPPSISPGDLEAITLSSSLNAGDVVKVTSGQGAIAIKSVPGGSGSSGGPGPSCGDGNCDPGECGADCPDCSVSDCCPNGNCDPMESPVSCPADCSIVYFDWGITTSFSSSTETPDMRCMHGQAPSLSNMRITSVSLRFSGAGTNAGAVAIYFGGSFGDATGATRQRQVLSQTVSAGWNTFTFSELNWPANTVTWICWKRSGSGTGVYYSSSSSDNGDFFSSSTIGRYNNGAYGNDPTANFPLSLSGGSFQPFWYSIYLTYYQA